MQKIKKFLAEYELLTIPIFLVLAIFSFAIIEFVFRPDAAVIAPPNYETFYYAIRTLLIAFIFLLVKWVWFKRDSPQSTEVMKFGYFRTESDDPEEIRKDYNRELIYANAKWFLYLFWLALIALAVFP